MSTVILEYYAGPRRAEIGKRMMGLIKDHIECARATNARGEEYIKVGNQSVFIDQMSRWLIQEHLVKSTDDERKHHQ